MTAYDPNASRRRAHTSSRAAHTMKHTHARASRLRVRTEAEQLRVADPARRQAPLVRLVPPERPKRGPSKSDHAADVARPRASAREDHEVARARRILPCADGFDGSPRARLFEVAL